MGKKDLKKELDNLFRSMDYIAENYLSKRRFSSRKAGIFYSLYQQLGLLWEFLGCQCEHQDGYRKKEGKLLCKICGKVKGTKERYYLLPVTGKKVIGRMVRPGKGRLKKMSKRDAKIVDDTIKFHGAKLNVSVFHGYTGRWDKIGEEINIAADRIVTLKEDWLTFEISQYIAGIKINGVKKQAPVYGGFLWELPQRILKKMPILLSCDKHGKLVEVELLR